MPTTQQNSTAINTKRFAALFAGFDTGNASEEEAMSKGRALRRMAAVKNLRMVALLETAEIRRAIDDQMQPVRKDSCELQTALVEAAALRVELTERTRDVRELAELLRRERESSVALRNELASRTRGRSQPPKPNSHTVRSPSSAASQSRAISISKSDLWVLIKVVLLLVALLSMAASIAQYMN